MDYSYQKVDRTKTIFYGKLTNETRELTTKECREKKISPFSYLFPWENIEEEWTTVLGKQFKYKDVKTTSQSSKTKKIIENE